MEKDTFLRMTRQRRIILRELRKMNTHPRADEIYSVVRQYLPRISLGTVYRNLEVLSQLGEIRKIEVGGSVKRFDGNTKPHYHVHCMACDRIEDVPESIRFDFGDQIHDAMHYQIMEHRLEFIGLCPECAAHQADRMMDRIDRQIGNPVAVGR